MRTLVGDLDPQDVLEFTFELGVHGAKPAFADPGPPWTTVAQAPPVDIHGNSRKFAEETKISKSQKNETLVTPAAASPSAGRCRRICWCHDIFNFSPF
jgi:hypothetical protein